MRSLYHFSTTNTTSPLQKQQACTFSDMYDRARQSVSDFVLGKTDIDELIAGAAEANKIDNMLEILQRLDKKE